MMKKHYYCVACKRIITDRRIHIETIHPNYILQGEVASKAYEYTFMEV
jgi:hypothetical protein